jgi:TolB protein
VTNPPAPSQTTRSIRDGGAFVVGLDGAVHRAVTGLPADAFALSLAKEGTTVAFVTGVDGVNTIATIGIDGHGMRTLVPGEEPAMSPNGTQIAFVHNDDIYVMDADGTNVRSLVTDPHGDEFPQWSPDGTTIVYDNLGAAAPDDSGFSNTSVIMTVPIAGGRTTQVSTRQQSSEPAYSPSGRRIVFRSQGDIWVMKADGAGPKRVAASTNGSADAPRWSPNGSRVAYTDYSPAYRPSVRLGANPCDCPLEFVRIVNMETGTVTNIGRLGMATFYNTPQWLSNDELLLSVAPRP